MSQHEARTEADVPKAPPGFAVDLFATGLNMPRVLRIAPNGDIFLAETGAGRVRVFHPGKAGAPAAQGEIFADGLQRPYGIAFYLRQDQIRVSFMSRRRTLSCAFPIAAER